MKIFIGADHRGYLLKNALVKFLRKAGHKAFDLGNHRFEVSDDYPDYAKKVALAVKKNKGSRGVALCGIGTGICIAANRVPSIRAVHTHDIKIAKISRQDDDTNVLCLGADFLNLNKAKKIISVWLKTKFTGGKRHVRRIRKLDKII